MRRSSSFARSRLGLKTTLVGTILLIVSATATVVYIPWLLISRRNIDTIITQINQEIIQGTSQEVERLFNSCESVHQLVRSSVTRDLLNLDNPNLRENYILSVLEANPNFTWVQFGYSNGDFIGAQRTADGLLQYHYRDWEPATRSSVETIRAYRPANGQLEQTNQTIKEMDPPYYAPSRPWYENAVQQEGETAWTIYVYRSGNTPGMDASITLRNNGEQLGVIGIGIELRQLSTYLEQLQASRNGEIFILNAEEELIASSDPDVVEPEMEGQMQQLSDTDDSLLQFAHRGLQEEALSLQNLSDSNREDFKFNYTDPASKSQYKISFTPVGRLNWILGTVIPADNYLEPIEKNQRRLLVGILIFIVGAAGIAILIADRLIARPILKIANMAADIEAGRFEVQELPQVAERTDELGQLARVFQQMARQVYDREYQMQQKIAELGLKVDEAEYQQLNLDHVDHYQQILVKSRRLRSKIQNGAATANPSPSEPPNSNSSD
jgi:methyl-accepting chemotaxis protein